MYSGCPLFWYSKLKTEIALSMTEYKYIDLSQVIRNVLPFISLLKVVKFIFNIYFTKPEVFCEVFEDNQSLIPVSQSKNDSSYAKHIYINYNSFIIFVQKKFICISRLILCNKQRNILLNLSMIHYL